MVVRREFGVVCAFLPGYAGGERGGIEGLGEVFGHKKCQGSDRLYLHGYMVILG